MSVDNDKMTRVLELVKQIISDSDRILKEAQAERDSTELSFYDLSLDDDGMPYSFGNADDVYSDGFGNGFSEGKYDLAIKINEILTTL